MRPALKSPSSWGQLSWEARPQVRWSQRSGLRKHLKLSGCVEGCTILLQDKWPLSDGFLDAGLHHLLQDIQVDLCAHLQPLWEDVGGEGWHVPATEHPKHYFHGRQHGQQDCGHVLGAVGQPPVVLAINRITLANILSISSCGRRKS